MRHICSLLLLVSFLYSATAQVKIHAHNDYAKPNPLFDALQKNCYSIEADVFLIKGNLLVAHTYKEARRNKTLSSLYIEPIIKLFKNNKGAISADSTYKTSLVIDIKDNGTEVLKELISIFEPLRFYFDRSVNPAAVQVIVSGDRGPIAAWKDFPSYIYFDGRPFEEYDQPALDKIAMISDNYFKYLSKSNIGDITKLKMVVEKAHSFMKPVRFWGSPDQESVWNLLRISGADIINTDKPADCRAFLDSNIQKN
ncbi:MAG: hypothetical protein ACKVOW_03965 [Chitinophagaceae bacterium]